jgi:hypothetical protein
MMQFRGLGDDGSIVTTINLDPAAGALPGGVINSGCVGTIEQCSLESLPVSSTVPTASSLSLAAAAATPQMSSLLLWAGAGIFALMLFMEIRK